MDPGGVLSVPEAQALLEGLASVFLQASPDDFRKAAARQPTGETQIPNVEARYRTLVEQLPAVLFMVYLDRGIGEAYVSPHIEKALGYTQAEWLEDPVRWYRQVHPDDNVRWSLEAADMFLTGNPLRSVYRVIARDGHVVWFHCEAKVVRRDDGQPWFIQGVAFDITELKRAEEALQEQRDFVSTILETVDTLILVLDPAGRVVHFNRACQQAAVHALAAARGKPAWELFTITEDRERFGAAFDQLVRTGRFPSHVESQWVAEDGTSRLISWSGRILRDSRGGVKQVIATGNDITESKRLEKAILDASAREQRRIGQDLHDGLGQHLTGIAFMGKVLERTLAGQSPAQAAQAAKIVGLVTDAIQKTRELSRGLLPVVPDAEGLMSALEHWSAEVEGLFGISCRFECDSPVRIYDENTATHMYRIAQEAVNNAIKHSGASQVVIRLSSVGGAVALTIRDNGIGLPDDLATPGMGLHIMNYRAKMIGGTLQVRRGAAGGTCVACLLQPEIEGKGHAE